MMPGFGFVARRSDPEIRLYGSSSAGPRPLLSFATAPACVVVLLGRLHYLADLGVGRQSQQPPAAANDAAVALAAYRTCGGIAGLERLEGEFSLLAWDARSRTVLAMRDPLGAYPLFWTVSASAFALSTRIGPLFELLPDPALEPSFLADFVTRPTLGMQEPTSEACVYHGVQRVLPGAIVGFRLPDGEVTRHRVWRWSERMADPGTGHLETIAEQVDALFRPAVRERLRGRTAAHLSGGMDSTSVALVARDWVLPGADEPLDTLSLIYERLGSLRGETHFLEAALHGQAGIIPHFIAADDLLAYDSFEGAPLPDEPFTGLFDLAKDAAMFATAAKAGIDTILTGEGGDDLLDVPPYHIARMLRRHRFWAAWRESARFAAALNTDVWPIFRQFGAAPLLPLGWRGGWRASLARGRVNWRRQREGTLAPWIRPSFARTYDLRGRSLRQLDRMYRSTPDIGLSLALSAVQARVGDVRRWLLASPCGMTLSHPFLDMRLVRLGLGIRLHFCQEPGPQKPLLAHAMRNVLPVEIRARRAKAHFNEVYFRGLGRNLPVLERLVRAAPDEFDMIDKETLIACLRQTALGVEFSSSGSMRLDLTLSLLKWLSLRQHPATATDRTEVRHLALAPDASV